MLDAAFNEHLERFINDYATDTKATDAEQVTATIMRFLKLEWQHDELLTPQDCQDEVYRVIQILQAFYGWIACWEQYKEFVRSKDE